MAQDRNGLAVAALVCGIFGIIGSSIPVVRYFTAVLAILGIIFGVKGRKIAEQTGEGMGLATAGLVLGIIGTVFAAVSILYVVACVSLVSMI